MAGDEIRWAVEADYDSTIPARSNRTLEDREQGLTRAGTA
jgi:hypothetical protein